MIWAVARELGKFPHEIEESMESWELQEYEVLLSMEAREARRR